MEAPSGAGAFFPDAEDSFFTAPFTTVNPIDLQATNNILMEDLEISAQNNNVNGSNSSSILSNSNSFYHEMTAHDSGVDLRSHWHTHMKQSSAEPFEQFLNMSDSPVVTNTPSPATDMLFSGSNSPGDFIRDHSSVSSPETTGPVPKKESERTDLWSIPFPPQDAIVIPEQKPAIYLTPDKTKTRAETQIKMTLTIDPLSQIEYIRFPRKTLAKPKHFASEEERQDIESKGGVVHMDVHLVCATAVESLQDRDRAMRRAAGTEEIPRRPEGVSLTELDKEDPSHPQNGGEVLICDGCKERERKRYDRKKKRGEDEEEFTKYENDRVIMINEKEHKKLKEAENGDVHFSARAKQVDFAMRIACYCRHQEEKSPQGYRVIFTFTLGGKVLVQHLSEIFHITDDHKNKEISSDMLPQRITIPTGFIPTFSQSTVSLPLYPYDNNYSGGMGTFSQATTPVMSSQFASPISPVDSAFSQSLPPTMSQTIPTLTQPQMPQPLQTLSQQARQPTQAYPGVASTNVATYARHQRGQSFYDNPLISPTTQYETHCLPRPQSFDNFNFSFTHTESHFTQAQQNQYYNSAPPSAGGTPLNLSRPASPTWEQGPTKKNKTIRCVYS
ncbi:hypothetical protein GRF29_1g841170 [Pseudopithomyces chartarum]|uniref:SPT23/MGA2-like DNA-binding domain-containing protein n=1 Tax=Pseudopithomyces chartarum TaxID=1892770 RepID=A0AAN6RML0_9PLEO|nr:hypothetical protein GRF29_1g841170 [Pseudopithomyces chartarum]